MKVEVKIMDLDLKNTLEPFLNGDAWEELITQCCRRKYEKDKFTYVPAKSDGKFSDHGIEAFTKTTGIVFQCYCPKDIYISEDKLYEQQRDKVTEDISKLKDLENVKGLLSMGVPEITEWIFIVPEYKDKKILKHLYKKQQELLNLKASDQKKYHYLSDKFECSIKVAEDFLLEIVDIINANASKVKVEFSKLDKFNPDWSNCESEKSKNVQRKLSSINEKLKNDSQKLDFLTNIYMSKYVQGTQLINAIGKFSPELRSKILATKEQFREIVILESMQNQDSLLNNSVFKDLKNDFKLRLEEEFPGIATKSLMDIHLSTISEWLADCPLEFLGD